MNNTDLKTVVKPKLLLVDGHSMLNRAFYGLPDLTNSEGLHTGAVFGFINILLKIIDEEKPDYMVVAFDVSAPTFRHEIYSEYKGTRKSMPDELKEQVPLMKEMLSAMKVCCVEKAGLEADDIMGTLAKRMQSEGGCAVILSGDRDLLQIADENIKIILPRTKFGRTEYEHFTPEKVEEEYGVTPSGFIDLKALQGDASDNVPGVPKVGEKTARELMIGYGSIEGIYAHVDEIVKKSVRESLIANRELCDLSKSLVTINTAAEIDIDIKNTKIVNIYNSESYAICKKLGFKQLLSRFENTKKDGGDFVVKAEYSSLKSEGDLSAIYSEISGKELIGLHIITSDINIVSMAICLSEDKVYYIDTRNGCFSITVLKEFLDRITISADIDIKIAAFDIKSSLSLFDYRGLIDLEQGSPVTKIFDTLIAAYLLNPVKNDHTAESIAYEQLGMTLRNRSERFLKTAFEDIKSQNSDSSSPEEEGDTLKGYACDLALAAYLSYFPLKARLEKASMLELFENIELPLTFVLHDMEEAGVIAKSDELKAYGDRLALRIKELEDDIYEAAGERFNINSPKQLGVILFEKLGIKGSKKNKSGYSTAADVLEKLAEEHEIVRNIMEYRALAKLKSTYADALSGYIKEDGRIHTVFNQTITATGRISSSDPNLQNIPMRTELGRLIRKIFVPMEGCIFTDADYSQIELRILAHMSGDAELIEAYHSGKDIHAITASKVFHVPLEEVTPLMRTNAKAVNFGIIYGISAFGLGNDLNIPREEAARYMKQYFETYPNIKKYLDTTVQAAKDKGYSLTLYGRRRPIQELKSGNFIQRSFGERVAMNAPIQGTAADIMKIAMIRVWRSLKKEGLKSRLILQIHDELLVETWDEERDKVMKILTFEMENAAKLSVPLEVEAHEGNNWYETK